MKKPVDRKQFVVRLQQIREAAFGEDSFAVLSQRLGIPSRTWENFESGVAIPDLILLEFLGCNQIVWW